MQGYTTTLLLGSNIGERNHVLNKAKELLTGRLGVLIKESEMYESEPWGFESSNKFLNKILVLKTTYSPDEILKTCLQIENELGRIRNNNSGYSSRVIDIDILYIDDLVINKKDLTVPHPRLHKRKFTIEPLAEILPDFVHPVIKKSHKQMLKDCKDKSEVNIFSKNK